MCVVLCRKLLLTEVVLDDDVFVTFPEFGTFGHRYAFTHFPIPVAEGKKSGSDSVLNSWYG